MTAATAAAGLAEQWASLQMQLDAHRPSGDVAAVVAPSNQIPVVVLTGFLGAGKTTLLATLLCDPPDDLVVRAVVNDVGSLTFDPTLVAMHDGLQVELMNGCSCCSTAGDLAAALDSATAADLLILEASGVADPHAIAQVVEARPRLRLDRVVAVVDALSILSQLDDPFCSSTARRQLDSCHSIVVSRSELASADLLRKVHEQLVAVAPGRMITNSSITCPAVSAILPSSPRGARLPIEAASQAHEFVAITVKQLGALSAADATGVLRDLGPEILRVKGSLHVDGVPMLVQATRAGHTITRAKTSSALQTRQAKVTVVATSDEAAQAVATRLRCSA